ncbi:uncharacterized protein LOC129591186 isoform X2 [Paramacrobiotus metropolitanus]|uniref:uncharacterized protein LOC129591186 isoform X2 n=1 Tax=Paramacrobiotus metropolitanus TaxID=2943436 RepID=UPI0024456184|nr:uncharacterized protein LOC129591186 isoform X2 [Paramacrobiotus metropolitanus]
MEHSLPAHTTETTSYPPNIHFASTLTTTTLTDSTHLPDDQMVATHAQALEEHEENPSAEGTLERLVKTDDVPSEDPNVDDGQQPLGIVESCFPYLARRNHHHHHHHPQQQPSKGTLAQFAACGGMKCHAYDDEKEHPRTAKSRGSFLSTCCTGHHRSRREARSRQ